MVDAPAQGEPRITGNLPIYKNPEPLSSQAHGALGVIRRDGHMAFAHGAHVVPITVGEFASASLFYPVIFGGEDKTPLAVMGLRAGENLFISAKGDVQPDIYLPAFIRRYPFVFAENKEDDRLVVCIDRGSDLVGENPDEPFFQNGEATAFTNDAIEFLKNFERQRQATLQYVQILADLDLFEKKEVTVVQNAEPDGSGGTPTKIADYFAVNLNKVNELDPEKIVEMQRSGALGATYSHLNSLGNWQRIINKAVEAQMPVGTA